MLTGGDPVALRRRNRRLVVGAVVTGVVLGIGLRDGAGYPLAGELLYWLGIVVALAIWWTSPVPLFDERDRALERRASHRTILVLAVVLVVGASLARLLSITATVTVPTAVWTMLWVSAGVILVWVGNYVVVRYRP
ncbi:MAG: hypothetical protein ABEJ57_07185 [Halobacteriaceae archaeon]